MKMKKPEMNVMRFKADDVIAASGPLPIFELEGFYDGVTGNLSTKVGGVPYSGNDLNGAFKSSYGGGDYLNITLNYYNASGNTTSGTYLIGGFALAEPGGYASAYDTMNSPKNKLANGSYKYLGSDGSTISFTKITQ